MSTTRQPRTAAQSAETPTTTHAPAVLDTSVFHERCLTATPFLNARYAGLRLKLRRYFDDERQAESDDGCSLEIRGEALNGCGTFASGEGICCTVADVDALRALAHALLSLADEAEQHGLFDGVARSK